MASALGDAPVVNMIDYNMSKAAMAKIIAKEEDKK